MTEAAESLLKTDREPTDQDVDFLGGTSDAMVDSARAVLGTSETARTAAEPVRDIRTGTKQAFGFSFDSDTPALRRVLDVLDGTDLHEYRIASSFDFRWATSPKARGAFTTKRKALLETDWESAAKILNEMPPEWRRLAQVVDRPQPIGNWADVAPAEMLKGRKKLSRLEAEVTDADVAFADLTARAMNEGETVMRRYLDPAANMESVGRGGALDAAAIQLLRGLHGKIMEAAIRRGWLLEAPDGTLTVSPKIRILSEIVDNARWKKEGYRWKPKVKDWYPTLNGDNGIFDRRCSDCTLYWKRLLETAREMPGRLNRGFRRAAMALKAENRIIPPYVASYADQWTTPEHDRFRRGLIARGAATLRNRYGDPAATILMKAWDEKLGKRQHFYGRLKDALGKDYRDVPEVFDVEAIEKIEDPVLKAKAVEMFQIQDALEGHFNPAELGPAARKAYEKLLPIREEARQLLAGHIFRKVRRVLEAAEKLGIETPSYLFRSWADVIGEDAAAKDPAVALRRIRGKWEIPPGETQDIEGLRVTGWGLRDYFPRIWAKTPHDGDGMHWVAHPSNMPGQDEMEVGAPGSEAPGERMEKWRWQTGRNVAKEHGFMNRTKWMRNLMHRLEGKDGYIRDPRWVFRNYLGSMIDKVYHERLTDDLDPFLFGTYKPLADQATDISKLVELLSHVPQDKESDRLGSIGSVDEYFSMRAVGALQVGKRFVLDPSRGDWKPAEDLTPEQIASEKMRWQTERWRWSRKHSHLEGDPSDWTLALTTRGEMFQLHGLENIRRAGIEIRTGGTQNFSTGDSYNAIKDVVRKMAGYDMDSGKWDSWAGPKSQFGRLWSKAADAVSEVFYQAMLGGSWTNPKAFMVQFAEGTFQNLASMDAKALAESWKDSHGAMKFYNAWIHARNPEARFEELKKEMADTPFVRKVLPVLEAGQWRPWHLLRTDPWHKGKPTARWKDELDTLRRQSFGAFTVGDMLTKIHAYYGTWKRAAEVGTWTNPKNNRTLKILPDYIESGDTFTHGPDVVSAHDFARMVVERAHFTIPNWAQPGLLQMPLWRTFGHLGTQASNVTFEMLYGMQEAWKNAEGRPDANEYMAQKASRYMVGMGLAFGIAAMAGWDLGDYTGAHVSDLGVGDASLGTVIPQTKDLPYWARFWGYQMPHKASLPSKFWFGGPGTGLFATAGDLGQRMTSGVLGPLESVETGVARWWRNWSPVLLPWPNARTGKHVMNFLGGGAAYTGADPDRPWDVTTSAVYGRKKRVKHRSTAEMIAEVLLPGRPYPEAEEFHRARASVERLGVRGRIAAELRRDLTHPDREVREEAIENLRSMGLQVRGWRVKRMAEAEELTTAEAMFLQLPSLRDRAAFFIETAKDLPEERRARMWEAMMGPGKRLGQLSDHAKKDFPPDLKSQLMSAAR